MDWPGLVSADGYPRPVIGVFDRGQLFANGSAVMSAPFPGPELRARQNDTLAVTVVNELPDQPVSVHWHGMTQWRNAWMDGVIGVTECGIAPGHNFTYRFVAAPAGTFWYHSHASTQYGDGLFGPLIIEPPNDPIVWTWRRA
jgi:FtsP/CotA-like multicopper oxidase with cupredoxin domain